MENMIFVFIYFTFDFFGGEISLRNVFEMLYPTKSPYKQRASTCHDGNSTNDLYMSDMSTAVLGSHKCNS